MGGWVGLQKLITVLDMRNGYKGGDRFSSLMRSKKKRKFLLRITSPEKDFFFMM